LCYQKARRGAQTYVVGRFSDVAEGWRGELGDDLLDLDVFGHDGGCWRVRIAGVEGVVVVVVVCWTNAKFCGNRKHLIGCRVSLAAIYGTALAQVSPHKRQRASCSLRPSSLDLAIYTGSILQNTYYSAYKLCFILRYCFYFVVLSVRSLCALNHSSRFSPTPGRLVCIHRFFRYTRQRICNYWQFRCIPTSILHAQFWHSLAGYASPEVSLFSSPVIAGYVVSICIDHATI
jgi:hypothetical protein